MTYFAYNFLLAIAAVVALPYYLVRARRKGQPWSSLPQRFGFLPRFFVQTGAGAIWLHAVSVGEVLSSVPLARQLRRRFPGERIFVSTGTVTGQELAREKLGEWADGIFYAPLDLPFAVRRVLACLRPKLVIVAETEIWPNLYRQVKRSGASLMMVNARISDKAFPGYRRWRYFFSRVLGHVDLILAQSGEERERLIAAGAEPAKARVGGNLKYDFEPGETAPPAEVSALLARLAPSPLIVAGSTRKGEEEPVVEAFRQVTRCHPKALLVLAPRHPQRFDEAARVLEAAGVNYVRRSRLAEDGAAGFALPGVLLLDSLGELSSLYAAADVVFMGGSLNGWGGHNVLEPALFGKPVIAGPAMQNFRAITETLVAAKGLIQIEGAGQLGEKLEELASDRVRREEIGSAARRIAEAQRGATMRAVEHGAQLYERAVPRWARGWAEQAALGLPAVCWAAGVRVHRGLYEKGWLARKRLPRPVVCVGNLTAGGAGKTPVVLWLAEQLLRRGYRPAVLTRGYRRETAADSVVLTGAEAELPPVNGDETQLLLRRLLALGADVPVGVGGDRYRTGVAVGKQHDVDVFLLDDGFQHWKLERDFDLVLEDATRPFGGGAVLPLGHLREEPGGLRRAGAILLTRTRRGGDDHGLRDEIRRHNAAAPIYRSRDRAVGFVRAGSGEEIESGALSRTPVLAFSGIGNPASFERTLEGTGVRPVEVLRFRDHHRYGSGDVAAILEAARRHQAAALVTTEKDLMNLWHAVRDGGERDWEARVAERFGPLPLYWLRSEVEVDDGESLLDQMEQTILHSRESRSGGRARERMATRNIDGDDFRDDQR